MNHNQITPVLNTLAQYMRCFTLEEVTDFADSDSDTEILEHALLADSRFAQLEERDSNQKHFISNRNLFQWFCRLSIRLARAKQTRLDKRQLALFMSSLRIDDQWNTPPTEAIQFGNQFGFVAPAYTTDQCIFPIAHILSFMKFPTAVTDALIENFETQEKVHSRFEELGRQLIRDGFSTFSEMFSENVRYVVQAREGLLTGERMTLEQVGTHLGGFTREWARQLEARFWTKLQRRPRGRSLARIFSTALVCNIISNKGRLVIHQHSPDVLLLGFLAKCAGVPWAVFPDTEIVVFGISQKDLLPSRPTKSTDSSHEEVDIDSITTWLESEIHLCLTYTDLRILAEDIAQSRQKLLAKPLTKGQMAYHALKAIGRPARCGEITEVYNSLFPEQPSTERNLHVVLSREQYGVVWIGIRSTFALKEWGYEHPSEPLFDAVTGIVKEMYEETGQPTPFTVIVAEMGKRRQVINPSSLTIAAHCNPNLRRVGKDTFIPKEPSKESQEEISAEELDRILREFEKKDDKRQIENKLPSISGKESHPSRFSHALLNLKEKLASLRH